ncbi:putative transcription factor [Hibiscus syriacus]|uniref:Transcription factor n=1 Tax=Hibiscus syriacus TaxID=106335 RepID=A0A6A2X0V9_HIBSY|nr:putative transcription factor [Hibiscus syriacus]
MGSFFPSRFEYVENGESTELNSGGPQVLSHIRETDEARKKYSNAKSISSVQFFGDHTRAADYETQANLQKFYRSSSISSADLFGTGADLDLSTNDLINPLSFQVCRLNCIVTHHLVCVFCFLQCL